MVVVPVPLLKNNYAYVLRDENSNQTAVVDPSEADGVIAALDARGWKLNFVINTHHHWDHVGGNAELKAKYSCEVIGPKYDMERLVGLNRGIGDGDQLVFGAETARVYYVPGHTLGHIVLHFPKAAALFCGDTLFSLGCGRMFEGTPEQMWTSLAKLAALPGETQVFCGHEYTQANARFALTIEPENEALVARSKDVDRARAAGLPTIPSTMASERACNPFLRVAEKAVRNRLALGTAKDSEVFAELRRRKDTFAG